MSSRVQVGQRRVHVTPEVIEALLVNDRQRIVTGLPDDARFVRQYPIDDGRGYMFVFESTAWDELTEGEEIPQIMVEVEHVENPPTDLEAVQRAIEKDQDES
jgi:hypothetical protein